MDAPTLPPDLPMAVRILAVGQTSSPVSPRSGGQLPYQNRSENTVFCGGVGAAIRFWKNEFMHGMHVAMAAENSLESG